MATRYLITGATGATGGEVTRLLLERGASVRALAHREDERSRELQQRGAEVVYGNLLNFDAMRSALAEVDRTYLFCRVAAISRTDDSPRHHAGAFQRNRPPRPHRCRGPGARHCRHA